MNNVPKQHRRSQRSRPGVALLVVLIVIVLIGSLVTLRSRRLHQTLRGTQRTAAVLQAELIARSLRTASRTSAETANADEPAAPVEPLTLTLSQGTVDITDRDVVVRNRSQTILATRRFRDDTPSEEVTE